PSAVFCPATESSGTPSPRVASVSPSWKASVYIAVSAGSSSTASIPQRNIGVGFSSSSRSGADDRCLREVPHGALLPCSPPPRPGRREREREQRERALRLPATERAGAGPVRAYHRGRT